MDTKLTVINSLPNDIKEMAAKLLQKVDVDDSGFVVYPDSDAPGSSAKELLTWYLGSKNIKEKPVDAENFKKLVHSDIISLPSSWIKLFP